MQPSPPCPVCGGNHWQTLGKRTWRLGESNDPVVQKRLRVLFEVWRPGSKEFTASSELCQDCGFIIYAPRPTAEELNDKYRFLTTLGPDTAIPPIESEYNAIRRRTLFETFAKSLPKPSGNRILDFGGGDGRLLKMFVDRGDHCFLVDYVRDTVDGVTKLGDTLDELPSEERFDGIVCSHVIEHVAQPLELLSHLVRHLTPEGRIYVEVPMEIWKKPPLQEEPVTHVNFFSAPSLRYLMMRCGLKVDECVTRVLKVPGNLHVVVHSIGGINHGERLELPQNGEKTVRKLLNPSFSTKLWWLSLHPDFVLGAMRGALRRILRRS